MARRLSVMAAMVFVVLLLGWAGVYNLRARRLAMQHARENQVTLTKAEGGGANANEGQGVSLQGKAAPAFTLVDLAGKKVSLADFKGKPVVVNFWATWCGPCKLEMPWFEEFAAKYKGQGLVVLGLSQDDAATPPHELAMAAQKLGVSYPILMPDDKTPKAYGGVDYLPETFYVDKNGIVVGETAGAPSKDEMEANIRKTIASGP